MQKKVYKKPTHSIEAQKIDPDALRVLRKLQKAGHIAYLVGGSVRDLLLQVPPKDYDISTSATPKEIRKLFRNSLLVGHRFLLVHIRFGRKVIEVSTFRSGHNGDALIVRDNQWGTPEEDVVRRDFTINALFYDAQEEAVIDYLDGYADLQQRCLKTIGPPILRFRQDPVRMIRLLKFHIRFGFQIDQQTMSALLTCRQEIIKSAKERVLEELLRMLESGAAKHFLTSMTTSGMLSLMLPTVATFLTDKKGNAMQALLETADQLHPKFSSSIPGRAILLSCLAFPLLQKQLHSNHQPLPLGDIQLTAKEIVRNMFCGLLPLSRQLQLAMTTILTGQYRLIAAEKKSGKLRVPQEIHFPLALDFLHLRACQQPKLQPLWQRWQQALDKQPTPRTPPAKSP